MSDSEVEFTMEDEEDSKPLATPSSNGSSSKPKIKVKIKADPAPSSSSAAVAVSSAEEKMMKKKKKKKKREREAEQTEVAVAASPKKKKVKVENGSGTTKKKGLKKLDKTDRLQYAMQSFLWWDAQEPPEGCQWRTMEHAGVSFPEPYEPHGVKMKYDGIEIELTPEQEEAYVYNIY